MFKIGDRVRIKKSNFMNLFEVESPGYNGDMVEMEGREYSISELTGRCYDKQCYRLKNAIFTWREDWLEPIEKEKVKIKVSDLL